MRDYKGRVRIIERDEESNVMALCRQLHKENGIFKMDDAKVRTMLAKAFDKQGGILGGIGEKGNLQGLIFLLLSTQWYTLEHSWEELFLYVPPECRKSRNAVELIKFAKWCADQTPFPLFIGILSRAETARKEVLYERLLGISEEDKRREIERRNSVIDQLLGNGLIKEANAEKARRLKVINHSVAATAHVVAGGRFFMYQSKLDK